MSTTDTLPQAPVSHISDQFPHEPERMEELLQWCAAGRWDVTLEYDAESGRGWRATVYSPRPYVAKTEYGEPYRALWLAVHAACCKLGIVPFAEPE